MYTYDSAANGRPGPDRGRAMTPLRPLGSESTFRPVMGNVLARQLAVSSLAGGRSAIAAPIGHRGEPQPTTAPPIVHEVLQSPGRALEGQVQAAMGARFGHDFSQVRIHTDERAAESAQAVGARAYTVGPNVIFGRALYQPDTPTGWQLLTHELTHVLQQPSGGAAPPPGQLIVGELDTAAEREARISQHAQPEPRLASSLSLQRQELAAARVGPTVARSDQGQEAGFDVSAVFEGRLDSVQTVDEGIVSYGRHQATLASGALQKVINAYTAASTSTTAASLKAYASKIDKKDAGLRTDKTFHKLLKDASAEPEMAAAQDSVFVDNYWKPAIAKATADGISSNLGKEIYYDTMVQGGLDAVRSGMAKEIAKQETQQARTLSERERLSIFLEQRRAYLTGVAEKQRKKGTVSSLRNAEMLEQAASAKGRVGILEAIADAGDLQLRGTGEAGTMKVLGGTVFGVDSPYREVVGVLRAEKPDYAAAWGILDRLPMAALIVTVNGLHKAGFSAKLHGDPPPRVQLAIKAVKLKGKVGPGAFAAEVESTPAATVDDRTAVIDYVGLKELKTRTVTQRVIFELDPPNDANIVTAYQRLNGQSMAELLRDLPELQSAGLFATLRTAMPRLGPMARILQPRLEVAFAAVAAKGKGTKAEDFQHAAELMWPDMATAYADQWDSIAAFLGKRATGVKRKAATGAK